MHPNDDATLRRMYGWSEVPREVEQEYDLQLGMFHRSGASGPIGAVALIALTRSLGCLPPVPKKLESQTAWREVPQDGRAAVSAYFDERWRPGVFLGFVEAGMLAVRLAGDPMIRELKPHLVELIQVLDEPDRDDEPVATPPEETMTHCHIGDTVLFEVGEEVREAEVLEVADDGVLVQVSDEVESRWVQESELVQ